MSFAEIKENVKELSEKERRKLVAYLVHLEESVKPNYIDRITQKIDDSDGYFRWEDIRNDFDED